MGCVKAKRQQTINNKRQRQKSIKSNYEITADVGATKIVVVIYKAQLTTTMTSKSAKMFVVSKKKGKKRRTKSAKRCEKAIRDGNAVACVIHKRAPIHTHTHNAICTYTRIYSRMEDATKKDCRCQTAKRSNERVGSRRRVRFTA